MKQLCHRITLQHISYGEESLQQQVQAEQEFLSEYESVTGSTGIGSLKPLEFFKKVAHRVIVMISVLLVWYRLASKQRDKSRVEIQAVMQRELAQSVGRTQTSTDDRHHLATTHYRIEATNSIKQILSTPVNRRGISMKSMLQRYLQRLQCLRDYPPELQSKLADVLQYVSYCADRVIIREGHPARWVYFIWSGSIFVNIKEKDARDGTDFDLTVGVLKAGDCFGELGVLYNAPRIASCISRETLELLVVEKEDFHDVLASTILDKTTEAIKYISGLRCLSFWPMQKICSDPNSVHVQYFRHESIVVKFSMEHTVCSDWVVIIKRGGCRIVAEMPTGSQCKPAHVKGGSIPSTSCETCKLQYSKIEKLPTLDSSYFLVGTTAERDKVKEKSTGRPIIAEAPKISYIQIGTVEPGECFGIQLLFNQPSYTLNLVSRGAECILINKHCLIQESNSELIPMLKTKTGLFPEISDLHNAIKQFHQWTHYKRQVIKELL